MHLYITVSKKPNSYILDKQYNHKFGYIFCKHNDQSAETIDIGMVTI